MNLSLLQYADVNAPVKRFSYNSGNDILLIKPANDEEFYLIAERFGLNTLIYIVCLDKQGSEKWRHNIQNVNRITWLSPPTTKQDKSTKNLVKSTKKEPIKHRQSKSLSPKKNNIK